MLSILSDTKMESVRAPTGEKGVKIRPLHPAGEVPRGDKEIGSVFMKVSV